MTDEAIDRLLGQTWSDQRVSRNEGKALKALLAADPRSSDLRQRVRRRAFLFAEQLSGSGESAQVVLGWLESIVKACWPSVAHADGPRRSEAHFSPEGQVVRRIVRALDAAKKRVDICVFTITDDRISRAIQKAHRRGVALRVLSDDDKAGDRGSDVARLSDLGIAVRIDRSEYHMHHKFAVFDGSLLLNGSYNWTRSANDKNFENVVLLSEPGLVASFSREFERLWERAARF